MADKIKPGTTAASIRAKRRASSIKSITEKAARGEPHAARAVVQAGKMNTRILTGQEDLTQWDDEELRNGQRRDKNGRFQGRAPKILPKAIHDELVRRTLSKAEQMMRDNLVTAVEALTEIVKGKDVEEKDRLRAISMIMDRVMGKAPEKVEVTSDTPAWLLSVNAGIVSITAEKLGGTPEDEELDDAEPDEEDL